MVVVGAAAPFCINASVGVRPLATARRVKPGRRQKAGRAGAAFVAEAEGLLMGGRSWHP